MILFTGVVAVATIALWWATRRLVTGAERTAERQLRAYMTVKNGKILHDRRTAEGWWLEWHPEIVKVGQTPAYNVRVCGKADLKPDPLPEGTDLIKELEPGGKPEYPRDGATDLSSTSPEPPSLPVGIERPEARKDGDWHSMCGGP
jgi:hypothetical protein